MSPRERILARRAKFMAAALATSRHLPRGNDRDTPAPDAPPPPRETFPAMLRPSSPRELARFIDHTLLRADATAKHIEKLCAAALQSGFAAV